jgi:hypothetical protein
MKQIEVSSLKLTIRANVPSSVEEYDQLAKAQGACLEAAVMNVIYRSTLAKFRPLFADRIENQTGIARGFEVVTNKDGSVKKDSDGDEVIKYTESEAEYLDRVCAALVTNGTFPSPEAALASFAPVAQEVMDTLVFDPSEKERAPAGPKKVSKVYLEIAAKWESEGVLAEKATKIAAKLGNWKVEPTVDSVARAVSEDQRRIKEATKLADQY